MNTLLIRFLSTFVAFIALSVSPYAHGEEAAAEEVLRLLNAHDLTAAGQRLGRTRQLNVDELQEASLPQLKLEAARARWYAEKGDLPLAILLRSQLAPVLQSRLGRLNDLSLSNSLALAALLSQDGQAPQAVQILRDTVLVVRNSRPDQLSNRAVVVPQLNLALALTQTGNGDEAAAIAKQAMTDARRLGGDSTLLNNAHFALAQILRISGEPEAALSHARAAYEGFRASEGEAAQRTIEAAGELAHASALNGDTSVALALMSRVADQSVRVLGDKHRVTLRVHYGLGEIAIRADQAAEAYKVLEALVPQTIDKLGSSDSITTDAIFMFITSGFWLGDARPCRYLPLLESETSRAQSIGAATEIAIPNLLLAQGRCAWLQGQRDYALRRFEDELAIRKKYRSADFDTVYVQRALARFQLSAGNVARAVELLDDFVVAAERQRSESALAWRTRFGSWVESRDIAAGFRTLAILRARAGEGGKAFEVAERGRARVLLDREFVAAVERGLPAAKRLEAERLRNRVSELELQLALQGDPAERIALSAQRDETRKALANLASSARSDVALLATFDAAALDRALQRDELFVQFVADGDDLAIVGRNLNAPPFVIASNRLPGLDAHIRAARRALGGDTNPGRLWRTADGGVREDLVRPADAVVRIQDAEALAALAEVLLQPLLPHLAQKKHLIISPDGPLAMLPFEALTVEGKPLAARIDISYAHSATMLVAATQRRADYRRADRGTPRRTALLVGAAQPHIAAADKQDQRLRDLHWVELPGVERELQTIRRALPGRVDQVQGEAAQKAVIKRRALQGELSQYRVLHFAAHAWYAEGMPDLASLVLGDTATDEPLAGYLTATELRGITLRSDLVVLSACTSTGGAVQSGEGLVGLVHALFMAGTAGAVVSLWPVADQPTAELMQVFYQRIGKGVAPAAALAQAKREMLRRGYPARDWAAFIYYGAS